MAWRYGNGAVVSAPIVVGGVAITVGEKGVYGVDVGTGEQLWRVSRSGGPIAIPAAGTVGDRTILVYTDQVETDRTSIVGMDVGTRKQIWRHTLDTTTRAGITIADGAAYTGDDDGNVYAFGLADGAPRWTAEVVGDVLTAPAVSGGAVAVTARDVDKQTAELAVFDADTGERSWSYVPQVAGSTGSGAAIAGGTVVAGFADRFLYGFDVADGTQRWSTLALSLFSPAAAPAASSDGIVVSDVSGGVYRVDGGTGDRLWDHQLNSLSVRSSPIVVGGAVLFGLSDGTLVAIDVDSGHLIWQRGTGEGLLGAMAVTPSSVLAVKGGKEPGLVAFEHDPSGSLVDIPSPTEPNLGSLFGTYGIALLLVFVVVFVPSRLVATRFYRGASDREPAADGEDEDEDEDEEDGG